MKNLDFAPKTLRGLKGDIAFHIYGPIDRDKAYWEECKRIMATMPNDVNVQYKGAVDHEDIHGVFSQYHVFFFPTRGENFGHVILESLASGCPVLLSDRTPWMDLGERGAGWVVPLAEPETFQSVLEHLVDMGEEELEAFSQRAKEYASDAIDDPIGQEQNRHLFLGDSDVNGTGTIGVDTK